MIEAGTYSGLDLPEVRRSGARLSPRIVGGLCAAGIAALALARAGGMLRLAIPAAAAALALVLYRVHPAGYIKYTLWVWFLTPLVRRVVDWRFGFTEPNFILLSPFVVSGVVLLAYVGKDSKAWDDIPVSFVLCQVAIGYGFVIGMLLKPSAETAFGLLNWTCPLLFGLYLYQNWERFEQYREAIGKTFILGVLVLGIYGALQFFSPPVWDTAWLENVQRTAGASFGQPEALQIRVWSTMNAPGPFANTMLMALLFFFSTRSAWKLPSAIAGYTSFLLSAVRTAWLSWVIGLAWILKSAKPRVLVRVIVSGGLLLMCLIPIMTDSRLSRVVSDRLDTFTDLKHDDSFGARLEMYRILTRDAIENPFGQGLQMTETSHGIAVDSGILLMLFALGWMGTSLFMAGILCIFVRRARLSAKRDEFTVVARAGMIAIIAQLIGGNIFVGVSGAMFWIYAGLYLAANKYHSNLREAVV
jgi:hypothetical protein